MRRLLIAGALFVGGVAACGGGSTTPDMAGTGADMASAGCGTTATPPVAYQGDDEKNPTGKPNLACLGTRMDPPAPTMDTVVMGNVKDFQDSDVVVGAVVSVYTDAAQVLANKPIAMSGPSDKDGLFTITVPKGYYRVIYGNSGGKAVSSGGAMTDTIPTYEFARIYNDASRTSVKTTTRDAIPGLVSVIPDTTLGVVAGSVRDCDNKEFGGGHIDVTMLASPYDASCLTFYFKKIGGSTLPVRTQKWTSGNGVFAALNVPPGSVTLSATAIIGMAGQPTAIGSATIPVIAGAITTVDIIPSGK